MASSGASPGIQARSKERSAAKSRIAAMSLRLEGAVLDEQGRGLPAPDQRQLPAGLGTPSALSAATAVANSLSAVARRQLQPARDGEEAAGLEAAEVILHCLHGVGVVLVQALRAGRRRAEGIEQRHLDQVVALVAGRDEAARLADADSTSGRL